MIEAKREGKSVKETKTKKLAPVIDLMAALQKSLNQTGTEKKPAGSTSDSSGGGRKRRPQAGRLQTGTAKKNVDPTPI